MKEQLTHTQSVFTQRTFPVILILDHVTGEANLGSIFRLSDAFGVKQIFFCGTPPNLNSNRLKRTARNTQMHVNFKFFKTTAQAVKYCKEHRFLIFGLEITGNSKALDHLAFKNVEKMALVLGNEANGIDENILAMCDKHLHINMFGNNSSMNVAQAAGIALYEITKSLPPLN